MVAGLLIAPTPGASAVPAPSDYTTPGTSGPSGGPLSDPLVVLGVGLGVLIIVIALVLAWRTRGGASAPSPTEEEPEEGEGPEGRQDEPEE